MTMSSTKLSPLRIAAEQHIDTKLKILDLWILNGIPWRKDDVTGHVVRDSNEEKVLDYFPTNIKAFALWDGTQNCRASRDEFGKLHRCSRTTLGQDYHLLRNNQIEDAFELLELKAREQLENENKQTTINRLKEEIDLLTKVVKRQEQDVVQLTLRANDAIKKLRDEKARHVRNKNQWIGERASLKAQIADFTKTLNTLTSLRARKGK
jgi:hypothetical protein